MKFMYFVLALMVIASCKSQQKTSMKEENLQMTELEAGPYSGIEEAKDLVIDNEQEWKELWAQYGKNTIPAPETPEIDFEKELVIACFIGMQNSGGHEVIIREVYLDDNTLIIKRDHISPGINCIVTFAITQPYCMIRIPKVSFKDTKFQGETIEKAC